MYIHINTGGVVIDATEAAKYIAKNENGAKYITTKRDEALGIVGSNDEIRPLAQKVLNPGWYDVNQIVAVPALPEDFAPNKYVYDYSSGEFTEYEGTAPETNLALTMASEANAADISDNREGLIESFESTLANASDIADCRSAIEELYEMIIQ